ncbi:MAG: pentapeptide repeat-containing protein [Treponema sp.]|nr:pentapeptide repeat-containing protein [Treponema sp.]MCL2237321.1 pentapeptide repeat-containing protein [Treponema sp.]
MFIINPCAAGCGRPAITGYNLCFVHQANPEQEYIRICTYIETHETIKDLSVCGMRFENADFSKHHFYGCNFKDSVFINCKFSHIKCRMSFFDFAEFTDCDFTESDIQFVSFAGGVFNNCTFEGAEVVHVNFEGATISGTSFNNSNLYNSRFISADLAKTTFVNCNLKRVFYASAKQENVIFKSSNTAEAVFEMEDQ